MNWQRGFNWLGVLAGMLVLGGLLLLLYEVVSFSQVYGRLPAGLTLGGVPVGGLTEEQARAELQRAYRVPIELTYLNYPIRLEPERVNFDVKTEVMLSEARQALGTSDFWQSFWDYLWLRTPEPVDISLRATYSQDQLRAFLADVASRFDRPGTPPRTNPTSLGFIPGELGHNLNLEAAINPIDIALRTPQPERRRVALPVSNQTAIRPTFDTLALLLRDVVQVYQFDGLVSIYLVDLRSGRELNFNVRNNDIIPSPIAYSGMSTIKVSIMVSYFARNSGAVTADARLLLERSIDTSANTATDLLMQIIGRGDALRGARLVTEDMQRLGLDSTFIAGLLDVQGAVGAPVFTPANRRTDLNTNPDPYNQSNAEEMGILMHGIYQCTRNAGLLLAAFPGQFTPEECQLMIDLLTNNQVGPIFINGGVDEGVVAHKHGWDRLPLTNVADTALVFTPGGNYGLTLFAHQPRTMLFDEANRLLIALSRAVYAYYNAPQ